MARAPVIVDTNVAVVANCTDQASLQCRAKCAQKLHEIVKGRRLVLDAGNEVFDEYRKHLSFSGQPGAGDIFFKWLTDNKFNAEQVELVELIADPLRQDQFSAFPNDEDLARFDQSDRKFVALALTHPDRPPIMTATDSDWWNFLEQLNSAGVLVEFLCGTARFE